MKKITMIVFLTGLLFDIVKAQIATTYSTGFDNAAQQSGWTIFRTGEAGMSNWVLSNSTAQGYTPYSPTYCLYHGYPVGGENVTDDWYVSPAFNFSAGGKLDSLRYSFSGMSTPSAGDIVGVYLLKGSQNPTLAASTTSLHLFAGATYTNDGVWRKITNIDIPPTTGTSYIAFRYKTTNSWLDVKFDNLKLKMNSSGVGLDEHNSGLESTSVFPNPANSHVFVSCRTKKAAEVRLYDPSGKLILVMPHNPEGTQINTEELPGGIYTVRITTGDQAYETKKLVLK